jgi:hypothetical protein
MALLVHSCVGIYFDNLEVAIGSLFAVQFPIMHGKKENV